MKKWFLYRVYKFNKSLFIFFVCFLAGTLFTNLLGWQSTPFFVWGMYSEKENRNTAYPVLRVTINDSSVINYTNYTDANKFFLTSPLNLYSIMKKNNGADPTAIFLDRKLDNYAAIHNLGEKVLNGSKEFNAFLPWYKRYLEQTTGVKIHSYKVELLKTIFADKKTMEMYSSEVIGIWKQ